MKRVKIKTALKKEQCFRNFFLLLLNTPNRQKQQQKIGDLFSNPMCVNIVTMCAKSVTQISFQLPKFQMIVWNITQNITYLFSAHILRSRVQQKVQEILSGVFKSKKQWGGYVEILSGSALFGSTLIMGLLYYIWSIK
jgi:hypothetical protein